MRHVRLSLVLVSVVCAFAVAAAPALAHEFTASKTGKTKGKSEAMLVKGKLENLQTFKFGPFKISCEKVNAKGKQAAGASATLAVSLRFGVCGDEVKFGAKPQFVPTRFVTPLVIEYNANGFVETGSELEEFEGSLKLAGGTAEIKVYTGILLGEHEKSRCTISWPEQTIPLKAIKKPEAEYSEATYSNITTSVPVSKKFPDGIQHSLSIANSIKGIKHLVFEGEPCEEWGKGEEEEQGGGQYSGTFPVVLGAGNLEFN